MRRPGIEILLKRFWWCEPTRTMQISPVHRLDESGPAAANDPEILSGSVERVRWDIKCGR